MSRGSDKLVQAPGSKTRRLTKAANAEAGSSHLVDDVHRLIEQARARTAVAVNVGQTMLYWQIGQRIGKEVLGGRRAAYGERLVVDLARVLEADYGRGFAERTSGVWCSSPRRSPTPRLSRRCHDN